MGFAGIGFASYVPLVSLRPFLVLTWLLAAVAARAAAIPVVITGTMSPLGLPFSSFSSVSLMADGRISFLGSSTGAFRRVGDVLTHVVSAGDTLPGEGVVAGVGLPAAGPGDCAAVRAFLVGGGSRILRRCGDTTDVVVATGQAAPEGGTFAEFVPGIAYGGQDQIAFTAILDDGSTAIVRDAAGIRTLIARTGGSGSSGAVFTAFRLVGVAADGRVAFRASVATGRDGLFVSSGDRLQRVVEVGEASPVGGTFRSVAGASINDGGEVAFRADLSDGTGGVFRVNTASAAPVVRAVVREGDVIAGEDVRVRSLPSSLTPTINAAGAVAFRATLEGAESGSAIYVAASDGSITRIVAARERTAAGVLIRLRDPAIADDGSLVIPASITGGGPALFVYRAGAVSTLARTREQTDIDTGLERFRFGQPSAREAAERAVFSGSRDGIFVATPGGALETVAFVGGPTVGGPQPLGGTFAGFDPPTADAAGLVVFGAEIAGSGVASRALIARRGTRLRVVARGDERVRGGRVVDFFAGTLDPLTRASVGPRGEIAFEAALDFGRTPRALLFGRSGRPQPIVRARKRAPGGGAFQSFGTPAVLRGRSLAFVAQVGSGDGSRTKLFLLRGGRARPLAVQDSGAPGRLGGRFDRIDPPDANGTLVVFRATLDQAGREGVYLASRRGRGLLVGTGDPAPGGGAFRGFASPSLGGTKAVFLGRLIGVPEAPGLYRVAADAVPGADAPAPAVEAIGVPGGGSPLGGRITEFGSFDMNRADGLAVVVDLVGASARSALLLVDAGGAIVP
jgi:hypothetical protein